MLVAITLGIGAVPTAGAGTSGGAERTVQGSYGPYPAPVTGCNSVVGSYACLVVETLPSEGSFTATVTDAHGQPVFVEVWSAGEVHASFCGQTDGPIAVEPGSSLEFHVGLNNWGMSADCPAQRVKTSGTISVTLYPLERSGPAPEPQPRAIDDSCPPGEIPEDGFGDVPASNPHESAIDCAVHWQVANGKSSTSYAPLEPVNREQMASFIARLVQRSGGDLPAASRDHFSDDDSSIHQDSINRLAEAGIVGGRGAGTYEPKSGVTRAQMAAFLTRAYDYRAAQSGKQALPAGGNYFGDDDHHPLQVEINRAAAAGFTGGFADGTYRPLQGVGRDQMASFLTRALDLVVQNGMTQVPAAR